MPNSKGGWDGTEPYRIDPFPGEAGDYVAGAAVNWDATNNWFENPAAAATAAHARFVPNDQTVDTDGDQLMLLTMGRCWVKCDAVMDIDTEVVTSDANIGNVRALNVGGGDTLDLVKGRMLEPVDSTTEYFLMEIIP